MFDLIIKNGTILDGTGKAGKKADIGIKKDTIKAIGKISSEDGLIIDADDLVVAPGFIDMHSHTDEIYLVNPKSESKITQGITTEIAGNCGISPVPLKGDYKRAYSHRIKLEYNIKVDWETPEEFFEKLEFSGLGTNCVFFAGHNNIRQAFLKDRDIPLNSKTFSKMKKLLTESLKEGVFGLSTGLVYIPSCFSKTEELIELAKVLRKYKGIYVSHIRNESDKVLDAVKEVITIGESAGIKVHISHLKVSGFKNWGTADEVLDLIKNARKRGIAITADQYPYPASSTGLGILLPSDVITEGIQGIIRSLNNKSKVKEIKNYLDSCPLKSWEDILISSVYSKKNKKYEGKNIAEIADDLRIHPSEAVIKLLTDERLEVEAVFFSMNEKDVEKIFKEDFICVGTDAVARSTKGIMSKGKPHPRAYGTFPRVIAEFVRKKKLVSLPEAVRKMTSSPAGILSLKDRGLIKKGCKADIVCFNFDKIQDLADYKNPHQISCGIEYVIINGKPVINKGQHTGMLAGKVIRKN